MKKIIITALLLLGMLANAGAMDNGKDKPASPTDWQMADQIVQSIRRTSFPDRQYNILDFGAVACDEVLSTEAINNAIITCNQNGGGTVIIPKGEFLTGPITMKSNVNLHLQEGAVIKFSTRKELYFPPVLTRWEGLDCYATHPMIYAYGESNLAITGKGTIDGQASNDHWWPWNGNPRFGWKEGQDSQRGGSRDRLQLQSENLAPIAERVYYEADALRPQLVNFYSCNTILIEDVKLLNSPFWVIHPLFCKDMIVKGVSITSLGPNGDGCDPESSSNILIEDCYFNTGDDCIAIKSGRNADGRKWNIPSENIVVRNCYMKNGHGGVVIGSEISGGYRNLFVENCKMDSPELERVIRIKSNNCRGGVVENVFVRNVEVGKCKEAVLKINMDYQPKEECDRSFPPTVRNVNIENVTCRQSKYGVLIIGMKDNKSVDNITVSDCTFDNVIKQYDITGATNVTLSNLRINGKKVSYSGK